MRCSNIDYVYFPHGGTIFLMLDMSNGEAATAAVLGRESAIGMLLALGPVHSSVTAVVRVAAPSRHGFLQKLIRGEADIHNRQEGGPTMS